MTANAPVFVGRESALEVLAGQHELAARGSPRIVWVEGEPGMGKTTLVRSFLGRAQHRVVWVSGDEDESTLPYGVLAQLQSTVATVAAADGTGRPGARPRPGPSTDVFAAGADLLDDLAAIDEPLVVVVDDLQWSDSKSAAALRFALRRLYAEPLLFVLVTRPHPEDALGEAWGRLLSDAERVVHVHLDGLTADEILEIVAASGHGDVGRQVAERLQQHTSGSPLHARALVDELGEAGLRTPGVLPAPRSFAQLTLAKLADLGTDAVQLVTAAAVLGMSCSFALAAELGGVTDPTAALDRAISAGLLARTPGGEIRFPHPLVRAAVYGDLPATSRRQLHLAAAAATTGARAMEHRIEAADGCDDQLADELERLADDELESSAEAAAHDHFLAAASLSCDRRGRDMRLLHAVDVLIRTGESGRAGAMRDALLSCADTAFRSCILGQIEFALGELESAEVHLERAVNLVTDDDPPPTLRRSIGARALTRSRMGRFEVALDDARTALDAGLTGWGAGMIGYAEAMSLANLGRTAEARAALDDHVPPGPGAPSGDLDLMCARGLVNMVDDCPNAATRDLTTLAERARRGEPARLLVVGLSALAGVQFELGQWDEAAMHSELAVSLAVDGERWWGVVLAHAVATIVHAARGRFDAAADHLRAADGFLALRPTPTGSFFATVARASVAQARSDPHELRSAVAPLLDGRAQPTVEGMNRWGWLVLAVEGLLGAGELDAARDRLAELVRVVDAHELWSPRADVARLEGLLAEAAADPDAAIAAYAHGLEPVADRERLPLPEARLRLAYGSLLRRTGARRPAIEQLRTARASLESLGASPFLASCDEELAACGLAAATSKDDRADPLQLTPAEQTVAHLVAQGLSNREAAARLYVSPKTVDYHLGNIYPKLGISSRRQLTSRLQTPPSA